MSLVGVEGAVKKGALSLSEVSREVSAVEWDSSEVVVVVDDAGDGAQKVDMLSSSDSRAAFMEGPCLSNSTISSSACMSSLLTHESCAGEYPFQRTRYCFFFHLPKVCSLRIFSTSHSGSSSMMSGGGWRKFGPCSAVSR